MEIIVVQPCNDDELKLLKEFLQKSRIKNRVLNAKDVEKELNEQQLARYLLLLHNQKLLLKFRIVKK